MNEPVTSESYAAQVRRLAELTERVGAQRDEAHAWYEQQCATARRAVDQAQAQVQAAERALVNARESQERVDAEANQLWQELRGRVGSARRTGGPPTPAPQASGDPAQLLAGVRDLLRRTGQPGELPGSVNPLLALCGVGGALLAYALGSAVRAAGDRYGGDLAVGLPVLALVVTLLGPLAGLLPAKLLADRRHALLTPRPIAVVLTAALLTTGLLLTLTR